VSVRLSQVVADGAWWRESMVVLSDREVPQRGSAETMTLSAAHLPPLADQLAPPLATRTAGLTLPEGWSCDGRASRSYAIVKSIPEGYDVYRPAARAGVDGVGVARGEPDGRTGVRRDERCV
jgi:hypothetical protein